MCVFINICSILGINFDQSRFIMKHLQNWEALKHCVKVKYSFLGFSYTLYLFTKNSKIKLYNCCSFIC